MLEVRRLDRRDEFEALGATWNAFLDATAPQAVFLRHEWTRAWFDAFAAGCRFAILVASDGSTVRGILPLQVTRPRFAGMSVVRLTTLTNGHSPRADAIVAAPHRDRVLAAFAQHLRDTDHEWDEVLLTDVVEGSPLADLQGLLPCSASVRDIQRRPPYIALDGDWAGFQNSLSRNFRRALRNNRNRVSRAGPVEVELVETPAALAAGMADVVAIGERSWQGRARSAIGSDARTLKFYSDIVRTFGASGVARLWFLRLGGRRVAFELHLRRGGVEYGLKTGFEPDLASLGVGTFLDQAIVEQLFADGSLHEYDLLGDRDAYKLRWTARTRDIVRVTVFGDGARSRLLSSWNRAAKPHLRRTRDVVRRQIASILGRGAIAVVLSFWQVAAEWA